MSEYAEKNRICLGKIQTEEKSNEITAIPELLDLLFLKVATVTIDAMGCQKKVVVSIRSQKANYVIAVKKNQQELYEAIENLFLISKAQSEHDIDHGRSEIRKCTLINNLTFLDERKSWKDLSSVLKVETERYDKMSNKTTCETRLYISSHKNNAQYHNEMNRGHWSIENRLHWMLDVVFNEDHSRRRAGNSAENFNIISKIALALIECVSDRKSKRQRRFKAGFDPIFREKILNL